MNKYRSLSHISKLLWHFMGPSNSSDETTILARLESQIDLLSKSYLEKYLGNGDYYERLITFEKLGGSESLDPVKLDISDSLLVKEPRCLCFCDIPINTLSEHMNKYGDIGLGFKKDVLESLVTDLKPVRYYPVKSKDVLILNEEDLWEQTNNEIELSKYIKVPTKYRNSSGENIETFDQIYEEREWRSFEKVEFELKDLAFILLPSRQSVCEVKYPKLYKLIRSEIGVIYADELFDKETGGL